MSAVVNAHGQPVGQPLPDWKAARRPQRITLAGHYTRLVPVDAAHHAEALFDAYQNPTDVPIWTYLKAGPFDTVGDYRAYLQTVAAHNDPLHYTIFDLDRPVETSAVGTIALMRQDPDNGVIEVGWVAFSPRLRRTRAASETLYLLAKYVFDVLGYRRLEWKCDALNQPSRDAAARFGFSYEGTFRQAIVTHGRNRDTAWFSMLDSEWPTVRAAYDAWLAPHNFDRHGRQQHRLAIPRDDAGHVKTAISG
ncbi:GNAT family protein [Robbsia sp. KACC 23696]|uniref:GNAT family N-acetyltransferase n=1 Tax=Robbsia sp. KACC 23696 TaxID=3149231 RepID=UPI00325BE937